MSGTSGRGSSVPFAFYDPESRSLRTSEATLDGDSTPFSGTLPPLGPMRNGILFARPMSVPRTAVSGCSSSQLLPTPAASNPNDGEALESWEARRQRNLAKGINGNGQGTPLGIAVQMLPTPRTSDTNGAGTHGDGGMDLRTAVTLLPTPAARDWKSGASNIMDRNARPLNEVVVNKLLPTPNATDGQGGIRKVPIARTHDGKDHGPRLRDVAPLLASSGGTTSPPSVAGSTSPDAPLPVQLSLDDLVSD